MAREGLERLDGVASVDEDPDLTNRTARVYLKKGHWLDPLQIAQHVKALQIGATLRGVEVAIEGTVLRKGDDLFLRIGRTSRVLKLVRLSQKVQLNPATKAPHPITASEREAYTEVNEQLQQEPARRACITGVLVGKAGAFNQLQVRHVVWR
jgi:hypothetical protein